MKKSRKEIRKQEKVQLQNDAKALRIYVGLRVRQSWQEVTDDIRARLDMEFDWFGRNGLAKGMLMLKDFMDTPKKGETKYSHNGRNDDVLNEECAGNADDSKNQKERPDLCAQVILGLDYNHMKETDNQKR